MTENKRYIVKGSDDFFLHIEDTTFTEDKHEGAIDNIYQVVDRLNEQEETIERLKRHIERNMISRITIEDVLSCAKDSRFYGNEEIARAIDCIAKDLKVNLY